jgi:hypothetical protein
MDFNSVCLEINPSIFMVPKLNVQHTAHKT